MSPERKKAISASIEKNPGRRVAIDCGAVYGGRLGCICLDTMEEYYV